MSWHLLQLSRSLSLIHFDLFYIFGHHNPPSSLHRYRDLYPLSSHFDLHRLVVMNRGHLVAKLRQKKHQSPFVQFVSRVFIYLYFRRIHGQPEGLNRP